MAANGTLGSVFASPDAGYGVVYHLEIALLFAALVAVGPLARFAAPGTGRRDGDSFGLAAFPG
jgi:BCD family chlorophyll transporter-like MFS transporter